MTDMTNKMPSHAKSGMPETFVYHRKPPNLIGTILYPLNQLKPKLPEVYENAVKKYQGREWLLNVMIPPLGCLWNDVLHFSLMHPSVIYKSLLDAGFTDSNKELLWFSIPLKDALSQPSTLYLNTRPWQDEKILLNSDFKLATDAHVQELSDMPEINLQYYRDCAAKGERPLLWKRAPHLLLKGELDVATYRVFDWREYV